MLSLSIVFGRTVAWLLDNLSGWEWTYYVAFYNLHPFGPEQEEYRAGVVASVASGAMSGKPIPVADLFPSLRPPRRPRGSRDSPSRRRPPDRLRAWAVANCSALRAKMAREKQGGSSDGG